MRASPEPMFFSLSDSLDLPVFFKENNLSFSLKAEPPKKQIIRCYDTFDWRGWNKKCALIISRRKLILLDLDSGNELCSVPLGKTPQRFFPKDIAEAETASRLQNLSKLRAFIHFGSVETESRTWRVLDENRKTVASLTLLSILPSKEQKTPEFRCYARLTPVRGYPKELENLAASLRTSPEYSQEGTFRSVYTSILETLGIVPACYSSKPYVKLKPDNSIQDSARELLLSTLEVIRANES